MSRFKLLNFVIFSINICLLNAQISDKRLCADEECKVPISRAKTLLRYSSPDSRILSFGPNADITIYSKSAGSREDLWGGEINGKRGYIPKHMVRETKILQKPTLLVSTEFNNSTETVQVPSETQNNDKVLADKVQEPYEVVDGTTIYLNPQDIAPSSTESVQATALPEVKEDSVKEEENKENVEQTESTDSEESVFSIFSKRISDDSKNEEEDEGSDDEDDEEDEEDIFMEDEEDSDESIENSNKQASPEEIVPKSEDKEHINKPKVTTFSAEVEDLKPLSIKVEPKPVENVIVTEIQTPVEPIKEKAPESLQTTQTPTEEKIIPQIIPPAPQQAKENIPEQSLNFTVTEKIKDQVISPVTKPQEETKTPETPLSSAPKLPELPVNIFLETTKPQSPEHIIPPTSSTNADLSASEVEVPEREPLARPVSNDSKLEEPPTTTLVPELEVPLPFEDITVDVTPNPVGVDAVAYTSSEEVEIAPGIAVDGKGTEKVSVTDEDLNLEEPEDEDLSFEDTQENKNAESNKKVDEEEENVETDGNHPGFLSGILSSFFGGSDSETHEEDVLETEAVEEEFVKKGSYLTGISEDVHKPHAPIHPPTDNEEDVCNSESCLPNSEYPNTPPVKCLLDMDSKVNSDFFLYLVTTAVSVIIFLFGYIVFDKSKREGPLVAKINKLEKELSILTKENQILSDQNSGESGYDANNRIPNELVENLRLEISELISAKCGLEEQVQSLEKELENSTEVGMELNKMLSEILSSQSGSEFIKTNIENLQRQLIEQQGVVNTVNETLSVKNTENHELKLELELSNKKVFDLQAELDKMVLNLLKIEEEKDNQQITLETEIARYKQKYHDLEIKHLSQENQLNAELNTLKIQLNQVGRNLELKNKEYSVLSDTLKQLKSVKNSETNLKSLLEVGEIKAEIQLLREENQEYVGKLQREREVKEMFEKRAEAAVADAQRLSAMYDEADKLRVETQTKLEVLSNYFKDKEAQLQKEISKHESIWEEKQGEATSTTERVKFMQEQLQNYKAQNESLKQEIISQEVELKSQISVLEKKAHENWVSGRQAERKLEDAKQEAAQLRHRLTLRERALQVEKGQHRLQSPLELNGELSITPIEHPISPPLIYGGRDHITKSPPIPGLPPFLPPPPGVPFMPPPPMHGVPPFIPPAMFPGDHRPPPLGRMSSPPINSRYSPSSRGYSPYDSSPSDSEYGTSPPQRRGFSPYNSRADDYKRPPPVRTNGRNMKGTASSGSANSNESLEKINRKQSKV